MHVLLQLPICCCCYEILNRLIMTILLLFIFTDTCCLGTLYLRTLMCHQWTAALPYCLCGCDVTCLIQLGQLGSVLKMSAREIEKYLVSSFIL